jgi:hypothetical protein
VTKLVAVTALLAAVIGMSAVAYAGETQAGKPNQLVGSWIVDVDRAEPLSDLRSLQTVVGSGSIVEMANGGVALRTQSHGSWERISGRRYASTLVFFRFNPQTGAYAGTQKINGTVTLSADGNSFTGIAVSTLYNPDGSVFMDNLRAPISGVRIQVERLPQ